MNLPDPIFNYNATKKYIHKDITFSRSSTGSYFDSSGILRYAGNNTPRFDHDPLTGICKGLLVEPTVSFLDAFSEQFNNSVWGKSSCTITSNAITSPDGINTADKCVEMIGGTTHNLYYSTGACTIGETITFSVYAKAGERNQICLTSYGEEWSTFDLSTGTILSTGNNICSIEHINNGWYRCSASIVKTNTTGLLYIYIY